MNTEKFNNEVIEIFEKKKAKSLLITSDGHVFEKKDIGFCKSHCNTFSLKYEEFTKEEFISKVAKAQKAKVNDGFDWSTLETLSQPELKILASSLGVKSPTSKKEDLLEALTAYKDSLVEETETEEVPAEGEEGYVPTGTETTEGEKVESDNK